MAKIIDMQSMRQINLFNKITRIQTKNFFVYNNTLVFGVPRSKMSQAIGKEASNIKKLNSITQKKIKIIAMPNAEDSNEISKFIINLIDPVEVNKIDVNNKKVEINASRTSRAALIGRNRMREKELINILRDNFGIEEVKIS